MNNDGTGTGSGGSGLTVDVALTEHGQEIYNYYLVMVAYSDAWWNSNGTMDVATFLRLYIMHEANWVIDDDNRFMRADWVSVAVSQSLYVGSWRDPTCTSSSCYNGVFNFIAERTSMNDSSGFISGIKNPGGYLGQGKLGASLLEPARIYGNKALNPTTLDRNIERGLRVGPSQWGNDPSRVKSFLKSGLLPNTPYNSAAPVYFFVLPSFYVYSPRQAYDWHH